MGGTRDELVELRGRDSVGEHRAERVQLRAVPGRVSQNRSSIRPAEKHSGGDSNGPFSHPTVRVPRIVRR